MFAQIDSKPVIIRCPPELDEAPQSQAAGLSKRARLSNEYGGPLLAVAVQPTLIQPVSPGGQLAMPPLAYMATEQPGRPGGAPVSTLSAVPVCSVQEGQERRVSVASMLPPPSPRLMVPLRPTGHAFETFSPTGPPPPGQPGITMQQTQTPPAPNTPVPPLPPVLARSGSLHEHASTAAT